MKKSFLQKYCLNPNKVLRNTINMKVLFAVFSILFSHAVFAGKWVEVKGGVVPLEVDTAILEEKLWEYVAAHSGQNFPPKESYTYQYKAINEHEIRINAMCRTSSDRDLSEGFIGYADGGPCYFRATYDFQLNAFVWLLVNGIA